MRKIGKLGLLANADDLLGVGKAVENIKERQIFKDKFKRHNEIDDMYLDGKISKGTRKRLIKDLDDLE